MKEQLSGRERERRAAKEQCKGKVTKNRKKASQRDREKEERCKREEVGRMRRIIEESESEREVERGIETAEEKDIRAGKKR